MPRTIAAAFFAVFFVLGASSAWTVFAEEVHPCSEDIARLCEEKNPGGGRIVTCLQKHEGELSAACRVKLQEVRRRVDEAKRACANDIKKFCRNVQEGEGRIARCLEEHSPRLSSGCLEKMDLVREKPEQK